METKSFELIQAWVQLSGILKNCRLTDQLTYNESIVMLQLYLANGEPISIKQITEKTRMLKSQVNRCINALEEKGLLRRCDGEGDRRIGYVRSVSDRMDVFMQVHSTSMGIADSISKIIGPDDTQAFIRIANKLTHSGYHL